MILLFDISTKFRLDIVSSREIIEVYNHKEAIDYTFKYIDCK